MPRSGFNFLPSSPTLVLDQPAYFREYALQRDAYFQPEPEEDAEPVEVVSIRELAKPISESELGSSPAKVHRAALDLGWEVRLRRSLTDVAAVLFVESSEEGARRPHQAGDVRFEAYVARHYWLQARHSATKLGFEAHWVGKGETGSTAAFQEATVFDPVGIPVENWFDYTKDVRTAKELGWSEERRRREGQVANARLNDGPDSIEHVVLMRSGTEFLVWLDDWLGMAGLPKIAPKPRKTKAELAQEKDLALLRGTEWDG